MPTIETKVEIARPPEIVAEAFLDPANVVHWTQYLDRFEIVSGKPGEVGSIAHLHYIRKGRPYVLKDVLQEIVPNKYFRSNVTGGGLKARIETWLREKNGNTMVTIRWSGAGSTLIMRLILPFLRGAILRHTRQELDTFKTLVETHGAHFLSEDK